MATFPNVLDLPSIVRARIRRRAVSRPHHRAMAPAHPQLQGEVLGRLHGFVTSQALPQAPPSAEVLNRASEGHETVSGILAIGSNDLQNCGRRQKLFVGISRRQCHKH